MSIFFNHAVFAAPPEKRTRKPHFQHFQLVERGKGETVQSSNLVRIEIGTVLRRWIEGNPAPTADKYFEVKIYGVDQDQFLGRLLRNGDDTSKTVGFYDGFVRRALETPKTFEEAYAEYQTKLAEWKENGATGAGTEDAISLDSEFSGPRLRQQGTGETRSQGIVISDDDSDS